VSHDFILMAVWIYAGTLNTSVRHYPHL